ncbi:TatD family deoxyribonuclease [Aliidiomarina shirensis]|uniref:TatD family deoxyribonuclease n=1 Tax=Aliidiomarina shirensis TaxID=1048642 RepID=A0A432WU48_9GAMM|nr:TatD family hydrolase [Aliidiomarina shirensis]RUO37279.1 TatD family deoxyribonuclease [Aliidiomarina shirensis]
MTHTQTNKMRLLSEFPSANDALAALEGAKSLDGRRPRHLTDSHCHIDFPAFDDDRDAMLARAKAAGVERFLVLGVSAAQWPRLLAFAQRYSDWRVAFGLHPYFLSERTADGAPTADNFADDLALLPTFLEKGALAVGEIGLDATQPLFDLQVELFTKQLDIAADMNLPVILHHRKTLDMMLPMVRKAGVCGGIVHAFSGSYQQAMQWIEAGFRLGVGGIITYERAKKTRAAIAQVPLESLVLETDSPDMPLCGQQGQRNEPANIANIAQSLFHLRP